MFSRSNLQVAVYLLCKHRFTEAAASVEGVGEYIRELVFNDDIDEMNLFLSDMHCLLILGDIMVRRSIYVPRVVEKAVKSYITVYSRALRTNVNLLMTAVLLDHSPMLSLFIFRYLAPKEYAEAEKSVIYATKSDLRPGTYIGDDGTSLKDVPVYFVKVGMTRAAAQCLNTMFTNSLIAPPQFDFLEIVSEVLYTASKYEMIAMCEFAIRIAEKFMMQVSLQNVNKDQIRRSLEIYMNNYNKTQVSNIELETILLAGKVIQESYIRHICSRAGLELYIECDV